MDWKDMHSVQLMSTSLQLESLAFCFYNKWLFPGASSAILVYPVMAFASKIGQSILSIEDTSQKPHRLCRHICSRCLLNTHALYYSTFMALYPAV